MTESSLFDRFSIKLLLTNKSVVWYELFELNQLFLNIGFPVKLFLSLCWINHH